MDDWSKVLERIRARRSATGPPQYDCPKCKDTGFCLKWSEDGYETAVPCECYALRQAKDFMAQSGISQDLQTKSFDNFYPRDNWQLVNAKEKAMRYAKTFADMEHDRHNSIMFCGQSGSGKTHLGTAICKVLMDGGVAVTYMAYRNAVTKIKQTVTDEEAYGRELERYTLARVLYIDDLLKGRLSGADLNIMYEIVNYRYMNNKPVIISTEMPYAALLDFDEAIGSRLIEMCKGNIVQLQGKELNYRIT